MFVALENDELARFVCIVELIGVRERDERVVAVVDQNHRAPHVADRVEAVVVDGHEIQRTAGAGHARARHIAQRRECLEQDQAANTGVIDCQLNARARAERVANDKDALFVKPERADMAQCTLDCAPDPLDARAAGGVPIAGVLGHVHGAVCETLKQNPGRAGPGILGIPVHVNHCTSSALALVSHQQVLVTGPVHSRVTVSVRWLSRTRKHVAVCNPVRHGQARLDPMHTYDRVCDTHT
jgi:hypothetical protein